MPDLHYMKWVPTEAEADEDWRLMSDAQVGFYMRCLNHAWINKGLPGDPALVAQLFGRSPEDFAALWSAVGKKFVLEGGRYVNPRQELDRSKANKTSEARAASGKQGGFAKANSKQSSSNCQDFATVRAYDYDYDSNSGSNSSQKKENLEIAVPDPSVEPAAPDPDWEVQKLVIELAKRHWIPSPVPNAIAAAQAELRKAMPLDVVQWCASIRKTHDRHYVEYVEIRAEKPNAWTPLLHSWFSQGYYLHDQPARGQPQVRRKETALDRLMRKELEKEKGVSA